MIEVLKPWGKEIRYAHTSEYIGKILCVNAGHRLSIQYHKFKDETMYVLDGKGLLHLYKLDTLDTPYLIETIEFDAGASYHIPPYTIHSLESVTDMRVLEVSNSFMDDIVRLDDKYGRK